MNRIQAIWETVPIYQPIVDLHINSQETRVGEQWKSPYLALLAGFLLGFVDPLSYFVAALSYFVAELFRSSAAEVVS